MDNIIVLTAIIIVVGGMFIIYATRSKNIICKIDGNDIIIRLPDGDEVSVKKLINDNTELKNENVKFRADSKTQQNTINMLNAQLSTTTNIADNVNHYIHDNKGDMNRIKEFFNNATELSSLINTTCSNKMKKNNIIFCKNIMNSDNNQDIFTKNLCAKMIDLLNITDPQITNQLKDGMTSSDIQKMFSDLKNHVLAL